MNLMRFVREIGSTLFSTATEDQVAQLERHIAEAQRTNKTYCPRHQRTDICGQADKG